MKPGKKHLHKKMKRERDPSQVGPTQVAAMIGESYQRARNLMLKGKMGEVQYDEDARKLSVNRDAVSAYKKTVRDE